MAETPEPTGTRFRIELDDGRKLTVESEAPITQAQAYERAMAALEGEPGGGGTPQPGTLPAALRAVGGLGGFFGPVAGAGSALAFGGLAQGIEKARGSRTAYNLPQLLAETAVGAVPGMGAAKGASAIVRGARTAIGSAALGTGGAALTEFTEKGTVTPRELVTPAVASGLLGAGLGARAGYLGRRAEKFHALPAVQKGLQQAASGIVPRGTLHGFPAPEGTHMPGSTAEPASLVEPQIRLERNAEIYNEIASKGAEGAEALAKTQASEAGQRLFRQVAEAYQTGEINPDDVSRILQREGQSVDAFVSHYLHTVSTSGRQLNLLRQLKKRLDASLSPETQEELSRQMGTATGFARLRARLIQAGDFRRASLVATLANTVRNLGTQPPRYTLGAVDEAYQRVILGEPGANVGRELITNAQSLFRALPFRDVSKIDAVANAVPLEAARLLQLPAGEVSLGGKYLGAINTLNRLQEHWFRRATFDARMRMRVGDALRARGVTDPAALQTGIADALNDPKTIPQAWTREAVSESLDSTFAGSPSGEFGKDFLTGWKAFRPFSDLVQPFPRFFVKAYEFLSDFSPNSYLKLVGFGGEEAFRNPKLAAKLVSRGQLGTMMLAGGLAIRNSEFAGPKWYQVRDEPNGPRVGDWRPFAPFATIGLFYGELLKQVAEKGTLDPRELDLTTADWLQGIASINRIAGSGLVVLDLTRGSFESRQKLIMDLVGQTLGGFTVPFRTFKDFLAGVDPEEAIIRETRDIDVGVTAPARSNIPGASRDLPPVYSPLQAGPLRSETPIRRQLTGLSKQTLNPVEEALADLGMSTAEVLPRTGVPELDRLRAERMGPVVEELGTMLVQSREFQAMNPQRRQLELDNFFRMIRSEVAKATAGERPDLYAQLRFKQGLTPVQREILEDIGITAESMGEALRR